MDKVKKEFLTVPEAAKELKVHPNTIRNYIKRGALQPFVRRIGYRAYLLKREEVDALKEPPVIAVAPTQ